MMLILTTAPLDRFNRVTSPFLFNCTLNKIAPTGGPKIAKTLREIVEGYDTCGALTLQQQLTLFHDIFTHLYM